MSDDSEETFGEVKCLLNLIEIKTFIGFTLPMSYEKGKRMAFINIEKVLYLCIT